jgi:hypothetical protein
MAPNIKPFSNFSIENSHHGDRIRCAILGCGMVRVNGLGIISLTITTQITRKSHLIISLSIGS